MDKPAVTVVPDHAILAAAAVDPAIGHALEAGLATASAADRGPTLIDALTDEEFATWDGRHELALVGRQA